jgi:predicted DNA-binding protein
MATAKGRPEGVNRTSLVIGRERLARLQALHQQSGAPVAELVRRAIDAYLAEHEPRPGRRAPR